MNDHVKALFEGQELSEEFKTKAGSIIESMLNEKEAEIRESVEKEQKELFESQIAEKTAELEELSEKYMAEEVIPTISKYLTAAVNEWQEENKLAIESGTKVELAESFLKGFVGLAESHNLEVPEGADSIVEKNQKELEEVKTKLDELTEKNVELKEALDEQTRSIVIDRVCSDLTESQKEKFVTYSESVEFKSEEQFESAVSQLKESYFPKADLDNKNNINENDDSNKNLNENQEQIDEGEENDPYLQSFLKGLRKTS